MLQTISCCRCCRLKQFACFLFHLFILIVVVVFCVVCYFYPLHVNKKQREKNRMPCMYNDNYANTHSQQNKIVAHSRATLSSTENENFCVFFVCIQKQILFIHFYCDTVVDYHSLLSLFCGWLYVVWARKFCLLWNGFLIEARENWGETMKKISVYIIGQRIAQECSFDCVAAVEMWSERRGSNSSSTKWASTKIIKPWSMIIAVARFTMHAPR